MTTPSLTRRRALTQLLAGSLAPALAACGGGSSDSGDGPANPAPAVQEFSADRQRYVAGEPASVRVRFSGASARIDPGIGPVQNGQRIEFGPQAQTRVLTLTVQSPGHAPATATLALNVGFRDRWTPAGSFTVIGHATAHARDGSVLAIGGSRAQPVLSSSVDRFDAATQRWDTIARMAAGRSDHRALQLSDGRILVCGGNTSENQPPFAELIDPERGTVVHAGTLAQPRSWHAATALPDGRALIVGGLGRDTVELWDPATLRWRLVTQRMAHDREHPTATPLPDGRVLITAGRSLAPQYRFAELFDPRTETFAPVEDAVVLRRQLHTAHALPDGRVLIVGGEDFRQGFEPLTEVLRFNPAIDSFTGLQPLAQARTLAATLLLPGGEVLLVGGQVPGSEATASTAAWTRDGQRTLAPLPAARRWHSLNRLPDGRLLVLGGEDGAGQGASVVLLYD